MSRYRAPDDKISEQDLWNWLAEARHSFGRRLHMRRVENLVGVGDPDVQGCLSHRYFDIELKTASRPKKATTSLLRSKDNYIRAEQKVWHRCRWLAGGSNFVLLQVGQDNGALRYLIPGNRIREIEDYPEAVVEGLSIIDCRADPAGILDCAASYRYTLV